MFGKAGFASINLPDTANTLAIDADPAITNPQFGYRVVGLGSFYLDYVDDAGGVGAGNTGAVSGFEGRLYAFHGQQGRPGCWPRPLLIIRGRAHRNQPHRLGVEKPRADHQCPAFAGSGNPTERVTTANGNAYVFSGAAATGPFASKVAVFQGASGGLTGQAIVGGGVSGSRPGVLHRR